MMQLPSLIPGFVSSYDADRKEVRVEIPGITDGADTKPLAVFAYPIGDRSENTDIRILEGDRVWLAFENGDPRFPIIMGYRPKHTGNETEWRRWDHKNIEIKGDEVVQIICKNARVIAEDKAEIETKQAEVKATESLKVESPQMEFEGESTFKGDVHVDGTLNATVDVLSGPANISGKNHVHAGVLPGPSSTAPPTP